MIMVDLARNHEGESGHNATREDATVVTELHRRLIFTFFTFFLYFLSLLSFFFTFFLSCGIRLAGNKTHVKIMRPEQMQLFLLGHHRCIVAPSLLSYIFHFHKFHFHKLHEDSRDHNATREDATLSTRSPQLHRQAHLYFLIF